MISSVWHEIGKMFYQFLHFIFLDFNFYEFLVVIIIKVSHLSYMAIFVVG